jgi:curved DNA-binding protein CbpA
VSERDYYKILGISPDANYEAVDTAYWSQVRKARTTLAPDDPQALPALNEAYEVLRTHALREQYDASRAATLSSAATQTTEAPALPHAANHARPRGLKPRLPWGRRAAEEQAAATTIIVGRLEREVHNERERMRADLEAELGAPDDSDSDRSRLMRVFGHLQQS